jgi:prepilin-type N-terminal cleavage/methylation domain-containing protein
VTRFPGAVPVPEAASRSDRRGFSMVEVIIAIIVLAIGVVGLAGTTAYIVRQVTLADLMTERSAAFQTIVDRLQSLPFDSVKNGSATIGVFNATWTQVLDGPQNKVVTIITVGPGLGGALVPTNDPVAVDTFVFRVLRR